MAARHPRFFRGPLSRALLVEAPFVLAACVFPGWWWVLIGLGLVFGGYLADRPGFTRAQRNRLAVRVALVHVPFIAAAWWWAGHPEAVGFVRVLIALTLGVGLAGGAGGLVLIGLDARAHVRG